MQIGCGEWGFRELPLETHFQICQDFGFRTLEFGIGGDQIGRLPADPSPSDLATFAALGRDYGVATPFCCLENDFTLPDAAAHRRMLARTLAQIRVAASLGSTHVRLFAGFTLAAEMSDALWQQMLDAFRESQALCDTLGMKIAIETHGRITMRDGAAHHEPTVSTDRACLQRLVRELPPAVGFNFDPGNLKAVAPDDRNCRLDLLNRRINYCHLKDWRRVGEGWTAVAIGDDDLDYQRLFRGLGFAGVYLIEYEPVDDVEEGIRRSLAYLQRIGETLDYVAAPMNATLAIAP